MKKKDHTTVAVLFVGRPNSGKTSLYNALTGADAHVGNFPGITVDVLEADVLAKDGTVYRVTDLPGIYTLCTSEADAGTDEGIARSFLERVKASGERYLVIQIADATKLELALSLTQEILDAGHPLLFAASQRDELDRENKVLDITILARGIGAPAIALSARDGQVKQRLLDAIANALGTFITPASQKAEAEPQQTRDPIVARELVAKAVRHQDQSAKPQGPTFTTKLDAWLLHPIIGPVLFLGLMSLVFAAVFLVSDPMTALIDRCIQLAGDAAERQVGKGLAISFFVQGVLGGAGTVLAFLPQIVILSFAMELLDASGYLARGAFLLDRGLRGLGLSGRAFLPLLMGHACAIPAIAATRIIRDPKERLTTMLVVPLMTCSARIPTYALLLSTFFAHKGPLFRALIFVGLYFVGILLGLIASLVLRKTVTRGKSLPLVLEMPAYRAPQLSVLRKHVVRTGSRFIKDVGTTIVIASSVLWLLLYVPMPGAAHREGPAVERSVAAVVGRSLEPLTKPAGFDWRINVGLIGSFGARELMVGTLGVIMGVEGADQDSAPLADKLRSAKKPDGTPAYSSRTALALLAFFVIACQCLSTVAAIRRETRSLKWPAFVLVYTYALAYVAAVLVYQVGGLLGFA